MTQYILPKGVDKKKRKEGLGLNQGRMDKKQRSSAAKKQLGKRNLCGGRGGGLRKPRLPFISPTSYLELSSKIAPIFISTLNLLPFLNFPPPTPGKEKYLPTPKGKTSFILEGRDR
jgi:hypothetical protein